jgi:hypothetical protein
MLIELGNHACALPAVDERPKVTQVHVPEFDDGSGHPEGTPTGGYTHTPGELTAAAFKEHLSEARLFGDGITQLPGHEALLAIEAAWPRNGHGRPAWVKATPAPGLTPDGHAEDLEALLSEFYEIPTLSAHYSDVDDAEAHVRKELDYWTANGPPGEHRGLILPELEAVYTNDGRVMNNANDGGDTLAATMNGTGTAATSTTLTTAQTLVTNALAGKRVYAYTLSGNTFVWGNVISNTNAAGASVITVDQWYVPLTPGGSAGGTPGTPWAWVAVDGGMTSSWFAAIGTGGSGWAAGDHSIATSSGSTEYTQAGGTLIRKICTTATTSGTSSRSVTLVPVFTANSSDVTNLPKVISVIAFFTSMVVSFAGALKFIDAISPTATIAALNDQLTATEVITGS